MRLALLALLTLLHVFTLSGGTVSAETIHVPPDSIPDRVTIKSLFIFQGSDTVRLGERLLVPGTDYRFHQGSGYFELLFATDTVSDTLVIRFDPVPEWVTRTVGPELPPVRQDRPSVAVPFAGEGTQTTLPTGGDVTVRGAKTFRVSTQTSGDADFGQSLDLSISGELTKGLQVSGSISDRGYDPTYGYANSRVSELDQVKLRVWSQQVDAQIGDIVMDMYGPSGAGRSVSGASVKVAFPTWHTSAAVARPRGRQETYKSYASDGFQGPYRITQGGGARPIVPGSEVVWLDGRRLERGADKDYTIDYALGEVTFGPQLPVDSRSRIEIDYEPLATEFRQELLSFGGGVNTRDSSLYLDLQVSREADDENDPLLGEFSDRDRALLASAGDGLVFRSGVREDSTGAYELIADSLPDSVFQYVGDGFGEYEVRFSYVGVGEGEYLFRGSGRYDFVGADSGDYLPIVVLTPPERTDRARARLGARIGDVSEVSADFRLSDFDQNVLSSLDDGDNDALFYEVASRNQWEWRGGESWVNVAHRYRQQNYNELARVDSTDLERRFLYPEHYSPVADQRMSGVDWRLGVSPKVAVAGAAERLEFSDHFLSTRTQVSLLADPTKWLSATLSGERINAFVDSSAGGTSGDGTLIGAVLSLRPEGVLRYRLSWNSDERSHSYRYVESGTRYHQFQSEVIGEHETVRYEFFAQDSSIAGVWTDDVTRHRVIAQSERQLGKLRLKTTLSQQWLDAATGDETQSLGRLNGQYRSTKDRLFVEVGYSLSDERRNARGVTYLEVEPGQGDYIFEDSAYIPAEDGDYIRVEEILSDAARVQRGVRSFVLQKNWGLVNVSLSSSLEEEVRADNALSWKWAVPFLIDRDKDYYYFNRRRDGQVQIGPVRGFYAVTLQVNDREEQRAVAGSSPINRKTSYRATLKQAVNQTFLSQEAERFTFDRDAYYTAATVGSGYRLAVSLRQVFGAGEVGVGGEYRRAEDNGGGVSRALAAELSGRWRPFEQSEFRANVELYRQQLKNLLSTASYVLTDNRPGTEGSEWRVSYRQTVRKGLRIDLSVSGRHADNRTARVLARGEVVATF